MPQTLYNAPSVAQVTTLLDTLAGVLKNDYASLGLNAPGESSTTFAAKANAAFNTIIGDGGALYGLGNPAWEQSISSTLKLLKARSRWDGFFADFARPIIADLNSRVLSNLPSGWTFTNATYPYAFDNWLTYINAAYGASAALNGSAIATPSAPTLAATTGGSVPTGSVIGVKVVYVGAYDWACSQASSAATNTPAAPNNAIALTLSGNVPTGVKKCRIFRTIAGGSTYYWEKDVSVTAGVAWSTYASDLKCTKPDQNLRQDWQPPSWMQLAQTPEAGALFALAFATAPRGGLDSDLMAYTQYAQLSPWNVMLNAANAFLGLGNAAESGMFGVSAITGAATQTYSTGAYATANDYSNRIQGFGGSTGIRARVTSTVNAAGTLTISYTYYDATNLWGNAQTQTGISATLSGTAVGSTASFTVTAGRIVTAVSVTSVSGFSSSGGTVVIEGSPVRSI